MKTISLLFTLLLIGLMAGAKADPINDLAKCSVFGRVDLNKLAVGKVMVARAPALPFPRDLAVQALYLVSAPVTKTMELHRQWDPARNPELKVYLHSDISAPPVANDFSKLGSAPNNAAVRGLVAATRKLPNSNQLQVSAAEAKNFGKSNQGNGSGAMGSVSAFWSHLLLQRAIGFASQGLSSQPPYDSGSQSVRVSEEVARLLKEQPKVHEQFQPIISQTPLGGGTGSLAPSSYWELFDVEGDGALALGASYSMPAGENAQMLDLQYYSSGGYFVFLSFYQLWPVTVNGHASTLVWRTDSLSSLSLSELHGIERMGSGAAMMKEIQRTIVLFQKDISRR